MFLGGNLLLMSFYIWLLIYYKIDKVINVFMLICIEMKIEVEKLVCF